MLMGALLIHLTGGRIEAHFHIFGSLAFLAIYRDWRVLITASLVVVLDHDCFVCGDRTDLLRCCNRTDDGFGSLARSASRVGRVVGRTRAFWFLLLLGVVGTRFAGFHNCGFIVL